VGSGKILCSRGLEDCVDTW